MTPYVCPRDGAHLVLLVSRNLFTKHVGCTVCGAIYIAWGSTITRCQTPTQCVLSPWKFLHMPPAVSRAVQAGPQCRGLL